LAGLLEHVMSRLRVTTGFVLFFTTAAGCTVSGQDGYLRENGAGAGPATDTSSGVGGQAASGTTSGGDSSSSGPDEPDCPHQGPPVLDPATLPSCPTDVCAGGARCLPKSLVAPDFQSQLANCDDDNMCVPDSFIASGGNFIAASCASVAGAEGRCLSRCLPQVAQQADKLPQDSCGQHEVCTPCYDPITQEDTGACSLSCDPGPAEPPTVLPKCCDGIGTCVPAASVPPDKVANLSEDVCPPGEGLLCAPDVFVSDPNYVPPSCQTSLISLVLGAEYKPGACLPACLEAVSNFMIQQDGCDAGFKCAPCKDPLNNGAPSGACDL
jgi:hypothetical protein